MRNILKRIILALLAVLLLAGAKENVQQAAYEAAKAAGEQAASILDDCPQNGCTNGQVALLKSALENCFDIDYFSALVIGERYEQADSRIRAKISSSLKELVFNLYYARIKSYAGGGLRLEFDHQKIEFKDNNRHYFAKASSRAIHPKQEAVVLDYKLIYRDGKWLIYDVVADGISLVSQYRSQCFSALCEMSIDEFANHLAQKAAGSRS